MDAELRNKATSHFRRLEIGEQLATEGDTRQGVGLNQDNLPEIAWCSVTGGTIDLEESIPIADYHIATYPITYVQYEAFVRADDGYNNDLWWHDFPNGYQKQTLLPQKQAYPNHPRDSLSWYQAVAFSRWLNAGYQAHNLVDGRIRLPYEWEWQWAAQGGTEQIVYPFGAWRMGYANTSEANLNRSIAVGMYPHAAALCGAMDMTGNVWEWCLNDFEAMQTVDYHTSTKKVRRGGSYNFPKTFAQNDNRDIVKPETRSSFNGLRLVLASE